MATGAITFPGISQPQRMLANRTNGIDPDIAIIFAQPQPGTPDCSGTATLSFGFNGTTINWTNALCDLATIRFSEDGHTQMFTILDKRWRWRRAFTSQAFNVRMASNQIDPTTLTSLATICTTLFGLIGETVDVSLVTSTEYPELVMDYDNCALMLAELLAQRGYVISLLLDDTVKIFPIGTGSVLPANTDVVNASISVNPPEIPMYLTARLDKTLVQSLLKCQAVGLDVDGTIRPANALSYAPLGGWNGVDMNTFNCLSDPTAKACALRSVGRWYQVLSQADGTQNFSASGVNYLSATGEINVRNASQYMPISKTLLESSTDVFGHTVYDLP